MYTSGKFFLLNGEYAMIVTFKSLFLLVTYGRFPIEQPLFIRKDGSLVNQILEVPLMKDLPKGLYG